MEFYTVKEVANILNVCTQTVTSMIKDGRLKALEVAGSKRITYRIRKHEIDRIEAESWEKSRNDKMD